MPARLSTVSVIAFCTAGAACLPSGAIGADAASKLSLPQLNSPSDPAEAARTLDAEIQRAQTLRAQGNYAEATRVLSQLMLGAPDDARVVGEYGKALAQQGRSQDAVAFLKRATELQPNDWSLYSALGVAYDQADDPKDAKAAFERALLLKPGNPVVLNNYAVSRMLSGDLDGAQKLLAQAKANGAATPKIASNAALLAQLKLSQPAAPATRSSVAVPGIATPVRAAKPGVAPGTGTQSAMRVMAPANTAPEISKAGGNGGAGALSSSRTTVSAANVQSNAVVMQQVPVDPLAGPVARATKPPRSLTSTAASQPHVSRTAIKKSAAPMLRTADQDD